MNWEAVSFVEDKQEGWEHSRIVDMKKKEKDQVNRTASCLNIRKSVSATLGNKLAWKNLSRSI